MIRQIARKVYCKTYCASASFIVAKSNTISPDGTNVPDLPCGQVSDWIFANYPTCPTGAAPGSNCFFSN